MTSNIKIAVLQVLLSRRGYELKKAKKADGHPADPYNTDPVHPTGRTDKAKKIEPRDCSLGSFRSSNYFTNCN